MAATDKSVLGIALQKDKVGVNGATVISTDASFKYLLYNRAQAIGPQNVTVPLDPEVGGGPMIRDVMKTGVVSGGSLEFIPRADTIALLMYGALGCKTTTGPTDTTAYTHAFELDSSDMFSTPYFTLRHSPAWLQGEQYQDVKVAMLGLNFRGANFLRGAVMFTGGLPAIVATTTWDPIPKVDSKGKFTAPLSAIELPTGTTAKVLQGSFIITNGIPLDQQWIVGSYVPDAFDVTFRTIALSLTLKVDDTTLYKKMMFDPAAGSAWAADMYKEAAFKLNFKSPEKAGATAAYEINIDSNCSNAASGSANVVWTADPISMRANEHMIMNVTGMFLADATQAIKVTVVNKTTDYAKPA